MIIMEKIPVLIFTGNAPRHRYVVTKLGETFRVAGVVTEKKKPLFQDPNSGANAVVEAHDKNRAEAESAYFGAYKDYGIAKEDILEVPWGGANDQQVYEWVTARKPKYILLFGSSIIKDPLLTAFENRIINMHLGLSPYYRGAGTNFWPLVNGEPECVGVTVHLAILKVDAGAVLGQVRPEMKKSDTVYDINCKTVMAGAELLRRCLILYDQGRIAPEAQDRSVPGKLCRSKDLTPESILRMQERFKSGMIAEFLAHKEERLKKFPILERP